jgi:hypothetical protein
MSEPVATQKVFLSNIDGGQAVIDRSRFLDEVFIERGTVRASDAALQLARDFAASSGAGPGGRRVATFDWAQSIAISENAGAQPREVGPCLILGAYDREDVPPDCIERIGRFEYAIRMPREVLAQAAERLIDTDEALPFGLILR